uniref:Uncharacterized protein n=1 Tax=Anguilla anguilla TaxID=7936 RepID=A0A0E9R6V6_ANGAN
MNPCSRHQSNVTSSHSQRELQPLYAVDPEAA